MMDLTLLKGLMNTGLGKTEVTVLLCKMSFLKMGGIFLLSILLALFFFWWGGGGVSTR